MIQISALADPFLGWGSQILHKRCRSLSLNKRQLLLREGYSCSNKLDNGGHAHTEEDLSIRGSQSVFRMSYGISVVLLYVIEICKDSLVPSLCF